MAKDTNQPEEKKETKAEENKRVITELADHTEKGRYSTGRERMLMLGEYYEDVQAELRARSVKAKKK